MPPSHNAVKSPVNLLLPFTILCTIGPSVTAATSLFVVRYLMCRYYWLRQDPSSNPMPGDQICANPNVEALTGSVMAGLATLDGIVSFLSTSYVQQLCDRFGRRPLLIALPLLATVSTGALMIAYAISDPTLAWILLAANGIFVSASTKSVFVPTLCVADVATEDERTRFYSRLEAVALLGPGSAYIASALVSRYVPIVIFPYYIALASQIFAALYAYLFIPETLHVQEKDEEDEEDEEEDEEGPMNIVEVAENLAAPIKPLSLLLPHRDHSTGVFHWKLFFLTISLLTTTSGTVFIATASLLFLTDKFNFDPEYNAWVLAYLTFSRFAYLLLIFPFVLSLGRRAFHRFEKWQNKSSSEDGNEQQPLLKSAEKMPGEEANHFDVVLAFLSVVLDAISLVLVSLSKTYQQVLGSFSVLALGAGDNPTFKSVFVSAVPPEHASEALAALDMILSAAKLASPPILGGLYAAFVEVGRPEMMFLAAGGCCLVGAVFLAPLVMASRR